MLKDTFTKFKALIDGTADEAFKDLLQNLQNSLEYCITENNILRDVLKEKYNCTNLRLNDEQRKQLATKAIKVKKTVLSDITSIYQPETILGWYRKLITEKYDWHRAERKEKHGQQPIDPEWEEWILKLSRENRE
jgi:hypothetical protein